MSKGLFDLSDASYAKLPLIFRTPRWDIDPTVGAIACILVIWWALLNPFWAIGAYVVLFVWEKQRQKLIDRLFQEEFNELCK